MKITATYAVKNAGTIEFKRFDLTPVRDFDTAAGMVAAACQTEPDILWARLAMRDYDSNGFLVICRNDLVFTNRTK